MSLFFTNQIFFKNFFKKNLKLLKMSEKNFKDFYSKICREGK